MDAATHPVECAAAADVGQVCIDICIAGMGIALKQCGGTHDHARLAVSALGHIKFLPGLLDPAGHLQLTALR